MITASYVNGVSTRKVGEVTDALQEGADRRRDAVDATFLDARWPRKVENISVLVAYGVNVNGERKLLAVTIGAQDEASWADLLRQLVDRGLQGVEFVIVRMFDLLRPPLSDEQSLVIRTFVVEGNARAAAIELLVAVFASSPVEREQRSAAALKKAFAAIDRR